jgi:hypothetical protein
MDTEHRTSEPNNRGKGGFRIIAFVFAGVLVALIAAGIWATFEIDKHFDPPPTTSVPMPEKSK